METNETETNNTNRALARQAVNGEAWAEWMPTIQNAGVDTLEFSFDVEIGQAMWDRLEEEKEIAQMLMKTTKAEHVPDWLNAVVHPVGAQGWLSLLAGDTHVLDQTAQRGAQSSADLRGDARLRAAHP